MYNIYKAVIHIIINVVYLSNKALHKKKWNIYTHHISRGLKPETIVKIIDINNNILYENIITLYK